MLRRLKNLDQETRHNLLHYSVLVVMMNIIVGAFLFFSFEQLYQMIIVLIAGIAYVLWGIIHHQVNDDLHSKVIFEYVLVALLAELIIFSLILRA
jgi:hypothetical protein